MAMTACFAGPIINILIALSLGFMRFLSAQHVGSTPVHLMVRYAHLSAIRSLYFSGLQSAKATHFCLHLSDL